jgi:hypothetical protein
MPEQKDALTTYTETSAQDLLAALDRAHDGLEQARDFYLHRARESAGEPIAAQDLRLLANSLDNARLHVIKAHRSLDQGASRFAKSRAAR